MDFIHYLRRDLNPQETQSLTQRRRLQALRPTQVNANGLVTYASNIAVGRSVRESASIFIQQVQVPGVRTPLNRFTLSIAACGGAILERCSVIRSRAENEAQNPANQRMPLDGSGISAVLYGDANRDGLTDILVRYSNGSGSLFQAQRIPAHSSRVEE